MSDVRFHPSARKNSPLPPLHAERLYDSLGAERPLDEVSRSLRHYVQSEKPPAVGAALVTCSDESERECRDSFERGFVRYLLPHMSLSSRAEFRIANLGGRYEWAAARVAEDHYSAAPGASNWKVMLVKINAHVSIDPGPRGPIFGKGARYDKRESIYCGALHATMEGDDRPFAQDIAEAMRFESGNRLHVLRDAAKVAPEHRALFAAAASARLQARRAMIDIQDYVPVSPTLWLVLPCVTLNRREHDTELVLGVYTSDHRQTERHDEYCGLGDRPEKYRLKTEGTTIALEDDELHQPRLAREHRTTVISAWEKEGRRGHTVDARMEGALQEAKTHAKGPLAKAALRTLLDLALVAAPVPAALVLFGEGLVGIHHANRAHRLAREAEGDAAARAMLNEVEGRIDSLSPEEAQHVVQLLLREYGQ